METRQSTRLRNGFGGQVARRTHEVGRDLKDAPRCAPFSEPRVFLSNPHVFRIAAFLLALAYVGLVAVNPIGRYGGVDGIFILFFPLTLVAGAFFLSRRLVLKPGEVRWVDGFGRGTVVSLSKIRRARFKVRPQATSVEVTLRTKRGKKLRFEMTDIPAVQALAAMFESEDREVLVFGKALRARRRDTIGSGRLALAA